MNNRTFFLGVGVGLVVTSLLLGLTAGGPPGGPPDPVLEQNASDTVTSADQLREQAAAHGLQLVPNNEWDKLKQSNAKLYLYIPGGFSWEQTADVLAEAKIIKNSEVIMKQLKVMGREQQLQPGLHAFEANESPQDVIEELSRPAE